MDSQQFRRFRKDMEAHTRKCWKCGYPKEESCKTSSCTAIHCLCRMTDPNIND